jgi:cyclase
MKSKFPQYYGADEESQQNAKDLRKRSTSAEDRFWQIVRNRRVLDLKIRRQHPVGPYVADFYCHELKLVIEIDGDIHDLEEVKQRDERREKHLRDLGVKILRFKNNDVFRNPHLIETELQRIKTEIRR